MPNHRNFERYFDLVQKRQRLEERFWQHPEGSDARHLIYNTIMTVQTDIDRLGITEEDLQRFQRANTPAAPGTDQIAKGFGCLVLAGLATLITWLAASDTGGTYYVFWGGMAYGAWLIIRGMLERLSN